MRSKPGIYTRDGPNGNCSERKVQSTRYHHSPALHEMQENSDEQCYRRSAIFKVGVVFFLLGTAASKDHLGNGDLQILFP
jgi:hypothetical protein